MRDVFKEMEEKILENEKRDKPFYYENIKRNNAFNDGWQVGRLNKEDKGIEIYHTILGFMHSIIEDEKRKELRRKLEKIIKYGNPPIEFATNIFNALRMSKRDPFRRPYEYFEKQCKTGLCNFYKPTFLKIHKDMTISAGSNLPENKLNCYCSNCRIIFSLIKDKICPMCFNTFVYHFEMP